MTTQAAPTETAARVTGEDGSILERRGATGGPSRRPSIDPANDWSRRVAADVDRADQTAHPAAAAASAAAGFTGGRPSAGHHG